MLRVGSRRRSSTGIGKPRNRLRANVVAPRNRAQRFTVLVTPLDRLAFLVRGELRLAPEFDALRLGVGAASRRAVDDPASFELRGNAEDRKD